jgi:hypothetical protein
MLDGSCREAILDVLADTDTAAGEPMTCNDVHALLQANDAVHSGDTVYKALRRMADDGILTWAEGTFRLIRAPPGPTRPRIRVARVLPLTRPLLVYHRHAW